MSMSESDEAQQACSITPQSPLFSSPTPSPMSSWSSPPGIRSVTPSSVDCPPFASTPLHSPSQGTEHLTAKLISITDILHDAHGTLLSTDSEREEDSFGEAQVSLLSHSSRSHDFVSNTVDSLRKRPSMLQSSQLPPDQSINTSESHQQPGNLSVSSQQQMSSGNQSLGVTSAAWQSLCLVSTADV